MPARSRARLVAVFAWVVGLAACQCACSGSGFTTRGGAPPSGRSPSGASTGFTVRRGSRPPAARHRARHGAKPSPGKPSSGKPSSGKPSSSATPTPTPVATPAFTPAPSPNPLPPPPPPPP